MTSSLHPKPMDAKKADSGGDLSHSRGGSLSEQVKDEQWEKEVTGKTENLLKLIGFQNPKNFRVKAPQGAQETGTIEKNGELEHYETADLSDQPSKDKAVDQSTKNSVEPEENSHKHCERMIEERDGIYEHQKKIIKQHGNQRIQEEQCGPVKVTLPPGSGPEPQDTHPMTSPDDIDSEIQSEGYGTLASGVDSLSLCESTEHPRVADWLRGQDFSSTDPSGDIHQQYMRMIKEKNRTIEQKDKIIERQEKTIESEKQRSEKLLYDYRRNAPGDFLKRFGAVGLDEPFVSSKNPKGNMQINLLDTWSLDHVEPAAPTLVKTGNRFTVSESGAVGISCWEKRSLSVIYPNTDKPPLVLSKRSIRELVPLHTYKKRYYSATFVKLSGRELLAANCTDDGNLYLWDTEKRTSKKVFDLKTHAGETKNWMNIFVIDDSTVGYGEVEASPDGSRRVFILNTDTEEWSVSGMIRVMTAHSIFDMCFMKTPDGTSCLLLCCPYEPSVQAMEMICGRIRWKTGKQQLGEKCFPWSICTDKDNTVYVADFVQFQLHLLSPEDGAVIKSINLRQYGIRNPFTVRCYGDYLYVEFKIDGKKYSISKFERELKE